MDRKLKVLGLALVAAFAVSAVGASSASASGETFHSAVAHTLLDATGGEQRFVTTAGELICPNVTAKGTINSVTVSETTAENITYTGCKLGGLTIHIEMRTCDYLFTSEATPHHALVHVRCSTPGDHIHIDGTILGAPVKCLWIPAQTPTGGGVTYTNVANGDVKITATVTGIEYTEVGFCGGSTVGNDATYSGSVTVAGTDTSGIPINISWN